jgi:hypothetical protein
MMLMKFVRYFTFNKNKTIFSSITSDGNGRSLYSAWRLLSLQSR